MGAPSLSNLSQYKLILTVALQAECPDLSTLPGCDSCSLKALLAGDHRAIRKHSHMLLIITGVGQKHSLSAAQWIAKNTAPLLVINFGTAGVLDTQASTHQLYCPEMLTDLSAENPIPSLGCWPFSQQTIIKKLPLLCSTETRNASTAQLIDMEGYYQAKICKEQAIPFTCIKYATDRNDNEKESNYQSALASVRSAFAALFTESFCLATIQDITVVIPSYNRCNFLEKAIQSVLKQSLPIHLIVVNDGSTDNSAEMLKQYQSHCQIITHKTNQGVSAARNTGIVAATSPWIAFLDSDDTWSPDKIEKQVAYLQKYPFLRILQSEETWIRHGKEFSKKNYHQKQEGFIWRYCLDRCLISPSSVIMHRSLLEKFGSFNTSLPACEDYDLWLKISREYLVGLEPSYTLVKQGGHEDQLSMSIPILDQYRVQSLYEQYNEETSPWFKNELEKILVQRLQILIEGAEKRGKSTERYREMREEISSTSTSSTM